MTVSVRQRIAQRVRVLRVARGWSQEGLAAVVGLHRNDIGHIERGEVNVGVGKYYLSCTTLRIYMTCRVRADARFAARNCPTFWINII